MISDTHLWARSINWAEKGSDSEIGQWQLVTKEEYKVLRAKDRERDFNTQFTFATVEQVEKNCKQMVMSFD